MVTQDADRVLQVEEDQPTNHRVERLGVAPSRHVSLDDAHVRQMLRPGPRQFQHPWVSFEADHLAGGTHELGNREGHMPRARTEVEHPHARADAGCLEEHSCRLPDELCLRVQPGDLGVARTQ